jgi:ABC-type multidrug transport system fused ATPase/permease subunit
MISTVRGLLQFPARAAEYWRFLRRERSIGRLEFVLVLLLATLTICAEAVGLSMMVPILSFVEHDGDVSKYADSTRLTAMVVSVYEGLGIDVSLLSLSVIAMLLIVVRQSLNFLNSVEIERLKWNIGRRLTIKFLDVFLSSSAANIRRVPPGQFLNLGNYECQATAAIARTGATLWMQLVAMVAYFAVLYVTAPTASLIALVVIVFAMLSLGTLVRITNRLARESVSFREAYTGFLAERVRAWKLIKLGGTLKHELASAESIQTDVVDNQLRMLRVSGMLALIFIPFLSAFLLVTLYIFVEVLALEVSVVMAFALVLLRLMPISRSIQSQISRFAVFFPSFEAVRAAFNEGRKNREPPDQGLTISDIADEVRFEDVAYQYPDRDEHALSHVNLRIPAGKMTAIVGPSGAGKSTLVDTIPRLIEPTAGHVYIDGTDVADISLRSLRSLVCYVPQDPFLFDATVAENISYLNTSASREAICESASLAGAAEFVEALPQGFDTPMGDAGAKLSGGQKQRIVLARAFLSGAQVLILDEPTSALDHESEGTVQAALQALVERNHLTVIIITHRLTTARYADQVVQIEDGKVSARGSVADVLGRTAEDRALSAGMEAGTS